MHEVVSLLSPTTKIISLELTPYAWQILRIGLSVTVKLSILKGYAILQWESTETLPEGRTIILRYSDKAVSSRRFIKEVARA